jgi:hypothetical protein
MTTLRHIRPLADNRLKPRPFDELGDLPAIVWVDPTELSVESEYQRDLSERSTRMIRHIVKEWSWDRFKPPVCSRLADGELVVVDGQHTAIAAATHPGIDKIPVLIVASSAQASRARAFVGHNKDRVAITRMQLHRAAIASGDEIAIEVNLACELAGVTLLAGVNRPRGEWKNGETIAIGALSSVVAEKGRAGGARILKTLVDAEQRPITALLIKAVFALFYAPEWRVKDDAAVAAAVRPRSADEWNRWAAEHRVQGQAAFRTVAVELFRSLQSSEGSRCARF